MKTSAASVVLLYHRLGSPLARSTVRGQYVLPGLFRWQLHTLMRKDYQPATLNEIINSPACAAHHFALTFDDGYLSVYHSAFPVLLERKLPAAVFVVAGAVGKTNLWDEQQGDRKEPLMGKRELQEMAAAGIEIGSHTLSHARLTELSTAALKTEVSDSKKLLEDLLSRPVTAFSYPYGAWDKRVREAVMAAGYQCAMATALGSIDSLLDPFAVPRVNIRWNTVGWQLLVKIRKAGQAKDSSRAHT